MTLTAAVVIGSSDYDGLFSEPMTVTAKNVTVDLNGFTLTAAAGCPVFEVQEGYTLTVVDNSEAKTGKLAADVEEAVVVAEAPPTTPCPPPRRRPPLRKLPPRRTPPLRRPLPRRRPPPRRP